MLSNLTRYAMRDLSNIFCFRGERIQFMVVVQGFLMAAASSG